MRKVLLGCGIVAVLGVVAVIAALVIGVQGVQEKEAATEAQDIVVRVSSDPQGVPFSGSYGTAQGGTSSVDGTAPQEYAVEIEGLADSVSASFQKQSQDASELRVEILADGEVKEEQSTTASFGVVTVSWLPSTG